MKGRNEKGRGSQNCNYRELDRRRERRKKRADMSMRAGKDQGRDSALYLGVQFELAK